ncbi:NAD(P)H-dependent oxidoreductase [Devosia sp. 2618]|uniref:NADPH-dependent FMN reductase n=1 Tax=Devosia sp. 2618 TaxID=3156454 RepID=UPI00339339B9
MKNVAVLLGSLTEKSINKSLAKAIEKLAEGRLQFDYLDIGSLPHYNNDLWENPPASVTGLKHKVEAADAVLIVMPEINRSYPAVVKNALDWASRPYGKNSWTGKPLAIAGASPGAIGTAAGQNALRMTLPLYGFVVMGQPEVYFQFKPGLIDDNFQVTDDQSRGFLENFVDKYVEWIDHHGQRRELAEAAE